MAGKRVSDVEQGEVLVRVGLENRNAGRNAEYAVEVVRISSGLVVRIKWGAIGAAPQVKDYPAKTPSAAQADYGAKIAAKEGGGYRVVSGDRSVSIDRLESQAEKDARAGRMEKQRESARQAKRDAQMAAMDRAASMAAPFAQQVIDGEVVYDEV